MSKRGDKVTLQKLREVRLAQGKSQTFMAKKLGYKYPSGYANIEMGRTKPSLEKAKQISEILGVDVNELFFEQLLHNMSKTKEVC
ncbi:helix-turn-helix transcriptional regulator [Heyndrickxia sporothermodurans]|uniref:helix-turn-helix transcriptional regulator n=1 Tax=Heyndrickxia sporothermodurans TaxID=46224 RepID=UPI001F38D9BA|nr:helix-turn-helix transcriptional regulator [Heyndrickxia sporothermodurans]